MTALSYTYDTAAAATGLSQSAIKRAVQSGALKAKRSGVTNDEGKQTGRIVIRHADLAAWLDGLEDA